MRIWDTHNILQKTVIKPSLARPVRTAVNAVSYNSTGSLIAAGLADGTVQVWNVGGGCGQELDDEGSGLLPLGQMASALVSGGPGAISTEPGGSRCEVQDEDEASAKGTSPAFQDQVAGWTSSVLL